MTREELESRRDDVLRIAREHGAIGVRLFGSTVRGDSNAHSDVDLLIDLKPGRSLFDLGAMQIDLEEALECRVDLVTENGLHWFIREDVKREAVIL